MTGIVSQHLGVMANRKIDEIDVEGLDALHDRFEDHDEVAKTIKFYLQVLNHQKLFQDLIKPKCKKKFEENLDADLIGQKIYLTRKPAHFGGKFGMKKLQHVPRMELENKVMKACHCIRKGSFD